MTLPAPTISVEIEDERWIEVLPDASAIGETVARKVLAIACPDLAEGVAVILLSNDDTLQTLNRTWRGKDKPTNVLSFPATEVKAGETPQPEFDGIPLTLGDMVLAYETVAREAEEQGKTLPHHFSHLVVHATLHLLGHDHMDEDEAKRMEALEIRILAELGVPDPYGDDEAETSSEDARA